MKAINAQARKLKDVNINLEIARMAVSYVHKKVKHVANWDEPLDSSAEGIFRVGVANAESKYEAAKKGVLTRYYIDMAQVRSQADAARARAKRDAELARLSERGRQDKAQAERDSVAKWDEADRRVYGRLRHDADWREIWDNGGVQNLRDIQILSDLAEQHGGGNCLELTALAFAYLHRLGVRPLDFAELPRPADHAFVVIGRKEKPDDNAVGSNWDDKAVICDPWAPGLMIRPAPGTFGPATTFGDAYAAYPAKHLEQKMKVMHPAFQGVQIRLRET
jgi:hypothetical protein